MDNPFESPRIDGNDPADSAPPAQDLLQLVEIAKNQKYVLLILLATILLMPMSWFVYQMQLDAEALATVSTALTLILGLTRAVLLYRLSVSVGISVGYASMFAVFSFVGAIGLVLLLVVNQRANKQLKDGGAKVGLLGVSQRQMNAWLRAAGH